MQAICTRIIPATNTKGRRIKVWCASHSMILSVSELDERDPHSFAARHLRDFMGWTEATGHPPMYGGGVPLAPRGPIDRVFVFAHPAEKL